MASVIKYGDPPDNPGGDFERACVSELAQRLPNDYLLITNLALPTDRSNFYEMDIIVASSAGYEILECKWIRFASIGANFLEGIGGYFADNVFSTLANKCRVLESRLKQSPFVGCDGGHPSYRVIVPDDCELEFLEKRHRDNDKVLRLRDYIRLIKNQVKPPTSCENLRVRWTEHQTKWHQPSERRDGRLGRFRVKRRLVASSGKLAYLGIDEPPCKVDVHLLETPFPEGLTRKELDAHLAETTRAMVALRKLRHPLIQCVIGHFSTGSSLVQVSDWFDGETLPDLIGGQALSFEDKVLLMSRITEALVYCHRRNVFHRNIHPGNVLTAGDCNNIQLTGFDCVKDPNQEGTVLPAELRDRDPRILPPEELQQEINPNYRLYDMFQAGVLFYWVLEDGRWPFSSTLDYLTGDVGIEFQASSDARAEEIKPLIRAMLATDRRLRPETFTAVKAILDGVV